MASKAPLYRNDSTHVKQQQSSQPVAGRFPVAPLHPHPATLIQRARLDPGSLTPREVLHLQRTIGNRAVGQLLAQAAPEQAGLKKENRTGLPDTLKAGIERLSGVSMDDVTVHYNSAKPAQLQALAYTQGSDIHVGPGQEKHLPHEAWHVVQQKHGRVRPTGQVQGVALNDQEVLEKEADRRGQMAQGRANGTPGADFNRVRVHTGAPSDHLARSLQVRAFTTGQDIFMQQGAYHPGSRSGLELPAHELTYVVQQRALQEQFVCLPSVGRQGLIQRTLTEEGKQQLRTDLDRSPEDDITTDDVLCWLQNEVGKGGKADTVTELISAGEEYSLKTIAEQYLTAQPIPPTDTHLFNLIDIVAEEKERQAVRARLKRTPSGSFRADTPTERMALAAMVSGRVPDRVPDPQVQKHADVGFWIGQQRLRLSNAGGFKIDPGGNVAGRKDAGVTEPPADYLKLISAIQNDPSTTQLLEFETAKKLQASLMRNWSAKGRKGNQRERRQKFTAITSISEAARHRTAPFLQYVNLGRAQTSGSNVTLNEIFRNDSQSIFPGAPAEGAAILKGGDVTHSRWERQMEQLRAYFNDRGDTADLAMQHVESVITGGQVITPLSEEGVARLRAEENTRWQTEVEKNLEGFPDFKNSIRDDIKNLEEQRYAAAISSKITEQQRQWKKNQADPRTAPEQQEKVRNVLKALDNLEKKLHTKKAALPGRWQPPRKVRKTSFA